MNTPSNSSGPFDIKVEFSTTPTCVLCGNKIHSPIWAFQDADGSYKFRLECLDCTKRAIDKFLKVKKPVYPPPQA